MWTLLAAGPLRPYDEMFQGYWAKHYTPNWWFFLDRVPNAVAGQAVCLPILATVAIVLAWRHRTWHPLAVVVAAEVGFYVGIGGMKVLIGRTAPSAGEGTFGRADPSPTGGTASPTPPVTPPKPSSSTAPRPISSSTTPSRTPACAGD